MIDLLGGSDLQVAGEEHISREGEGSRVLIIRGIETYWCWKGKVIEGCTCYSDSRSSDENWSPGEDGSHVRCSDLRRKIQESVVRVTVIDADSKGSISFVAMFNG